MTEATLQVPGFDLAWALATQYFVPSFVILLGLIAWIYFKKGSPITSAMFLGFGVVLAAGEGASIYFTKKTISENHWLLDASDPQTGALLFMLLLALLLIIVIHLGKLTIDRLRGR